jgi:hypothetical protein
MTKKKDKNKRQSGGGSPPGSDNPRMIHPIIIYPFHHPEDTTHLRALYHGLIRKLAKDEDTYHSPITVIDQKTYDENCLKPGFSDLWNNVIKAYSEIVFDRSVETCQRWLTGFGHAYEKSRQNDRTSDVYWLIPGDFYYATDTGQKALAEMKEIPTKVYKREQGCELCLGEIIAPPNSSKQLIDTYGTYGLLYNWFPVQAQVIAGITSKPRTEFFAIGHNYLHQVLTRRWYPYEQTLAILLFVMVGNGPVKTILNVELGKITDESESRDSLASAISQVERIERMLKLYWRELYAKHDTSWPDKFRKLDAQSQQIRGAAMVIFEQVLK